MVDLNCDNSNIYEFMVVKDNVMIHKQIELRNGLTYFRIKKRRVQ